MICNRLEQLHVFWRFEQWGWRAVASAGRIVTWVRHGFRDVELKTGPVLRFYLLMGDSRPISAVYICLLSCADPLRSLSWCRRCTPPNTLLFHQVRMRTFVMKVVSMSSLSMSSRLGKDVPVVAHARCFTPPSPCSFMFWAIPQSPIYLRCCSAGQ